MALPFATPESCGVRSSDLVRLAQRLCQLAPMQDSHSFMVVRHGKIVAKAAFAPYTFDVPHMVFSVTKSLTSTAVGFAVQEGLLRTDETLMEIFPDKIPKNASDAIKNVTVRDMLRMSVVQDKSGAIHAYQGTDPFTLPDRVRFFLECDVRSCGEEFQYNGECSHALASAVERRAGMSLLDYLESRLFQPLGMNRPTARFLKCNDFRGDSGARLTLDDFALLGQFYLQKGMWNGKQLLDRAWCEEATKKQIDTDSPGLGDDWSSGYCYQFWRGRHNSFRFCGANGQMCAVLPDADVMFVIQSGTDTNHLHAVLDAFYDTVLPNLSNVPYPEDAEANRAMREFFGTLKTPACYSHPSPTTLAIQGKTFVSEPHDRIADVSFSFESDVCNVTLNLTDGTCLQLPVGLSEPKLSAVQHSKFVALDCDDETVYASCGCWTDLNTFRMTCRQLASCVTLYLTVSVTEGQIALTAQTRRGTWDKGVTVILTEKGDS